MFYDLKEFGKWFAGFGKMEKWFLWKIGRGDKICLVHDLCIRCNDYPKLSNKLVEFLNQSGYIAISDVVQIQIVKSGF